MAAGVEEIDRFPLAVRVVRLLFPMAGLLVLSAWSIGVNTRQTVWSSRSRIQLEMAKISQPA